MPQTVEDFTSAAAYETVAAQAPQAQDAAPRNGRVSRSLDSRTQTDRRTHTRASWPVAFLAAGGSGAGIALVGGSLLGPIGAIGGGIIGLTLGMLVQRHRT